MRGEYEDYREEGVINPFWASPRHMVVLNRNGERKFRSFLCPQRGDRSIPCTSCTKQYREQDDSVSTKTVNYFTVLSLSDHNEGRWWFKFTNKYGDEKFEYATSPGECRKFENQGGERVLGRKGYLALGPAHFRQVLDLDSQISQQCSNCVMPGEKPAKLHLHSLVCDPCGNVLEDMETTMLSRKELDDLSNSDNVSCSSCRHVGYPKIVHECPDCDEPTQASIFDVVIPLAKVGKGTDSKVTVPYGEVIDFVDNASVVENDAEVMLYNGHDFSPAVQAMYAPLDFFDVFSVELMPNYQDAKIWS